VVKLNRIFPVDICIVVRFKHVGVAGKWEEKSAHCFK
jgi:hypothetical protein